MSSVPRSQSSPAPAAAWPGPGAVETAGSGGCSNARSCRSAAAAVHTSNFSAMRESTWFHDRSQDFWISGEPSRPRSKIARITAISQRTEVTRTERSTSAILTFVPISWMCKKQTSVSHSSTESEIISLDAGLRMDGPLALDLSDMVIEVLRSTNNTARQGRRGTGDHSIKKIKTKTPTEKRKSNRQMWSTYPPTHILLKVSLSCTFLKTAKLSVCHQNDYQRTKSNNETRVENPQSCARLVVRQNQLGTKDPNHTR